MSDIPHSTLGVAYRRYVPPQPFGLTLEDRLLHLYLIGQTGTGKSTLLFNLALQDAERRTGFCLIDPHGDLAELLHRSLLTEHLYFDVADPACPLGYNPLSKVSAAYRPLVASGLIETLKKQWPDAWGARMEHILRYAVLALLEQPTADLRDILRLLTFKGFRKQVTERLTDPQTRFFWKHEFHALNHQQGDGVGPIANKLGAFLASERVRTVTCEPERPIRFRSVMDTGQILIVNLAKGRLGADISNILGGLITSSIMHAAFSRHGLPPAVRRPFFLYADEFHNFTTKAFVDLMPEARKYGLGLTIAHQHAAQVSADIMSAVVGNVGSMIVFRVGPEDAPRFAKSLAPFEASDLAKQPNYTATVSMMHAGEKLPPFTATTYPPYRP